MNKREKKLKLFWQRLYTDFAEKKIDEFMKDYEQHFDLDTYPEDRRKVKDDWKYYKSSVSVNLPGEWN